MRIFCYCLLLIIGFLHVQEGSVLHCVLSRHMNSWYTVHVFLIFLGVKSVYLAFSKFQALMVNNKIQLSCMGSSCILLLHVSELSCIGNATYSVNLSEGGFRLYNV